jgi:hypothetical protein
VFPVNQEHQTDSVPTESFPIAVTVICGPPDLSCTIPPTLNGLSAMSDSFHLYGRGFKAEHLKLIADSEQFQDYREPPLRLGDIVRLNSGGPQCLVVGLPDFKSVEISWRDDQGTHETSFPRACLHRVRLLG